MSTAAAANPSDDMGEATLALETPVEVTRPETHPDRGREAIVHHDVPALAGHLLLMSGREAALARAAAARRAGRRAERASRVLDIAVCVLIAPLALVAGALVALTIKVVDGGPVIFVQERTGRDGKRFRMFKFRTMVPNAEALKAELARLSVVSYPVFKIKNDPRLTRTGRYLRRSFLDELPQLLNVLKGDMSIVGPRPTTAPPSDYMLWQTARLEGRPGLTGLWQTTPNSEDLEFADRVRLDIRYLSDRSVGWDLRLILRTLRRCVRRVGL